jgi:hypothetical protein
MSNASASASASATSARIVVLALLVSVGAIAATQPGLARAVAKVKLGEEVSALPPPDELRTMSLGYRAALADLLWASLKVEWGRRAEEHRKFPDIQRYLDGILALEPDHPTLYRFVDTLLVYRPGEIGTEADARAARAYLERGTRERPYDADVWLEYGQFIAFLAPTFLKDKAEIEAWRKDGALAMARSIELGSNPGRSLTVATLLNQAGERQAAIKQLERTYALTEDPQMREQWRLKLAYLSGKRDVESRVGAFEYEWRTRYPFLRREGALLLGQTTSPAACAGPDARERRECPADWTAASDQN